MAAALNPNKTDFRMSPGLSTHVVYVWGQYRAVISVGLSILSCPRFGFSSFISLHRSKGEGTAEVNYEEDLEGSQLLIHLSETVKTNASRNRIIMQNEWIKRAFKVITCTSEC